MKTNGKTIAGCATRYAIPWLWARGAPADFLRGVE